MTDKNTKKTQSEKSDAPSVIVNGQYVKDLSFESPNSPACFSKQNNNPDVNFSVDINVESLSPTTFEVVLVVTANASSDGKSLFIAELSYGGIFTVTGVEGEQREALLLVYCPGILFPFARRIIADSTRDGGFPPLMMDPIDFATLYQQNRDKVQKKTGEQK